MPIVQKEENIVITNCLQELEDILPVLIVDNNNKIIITIKNFNLKIELINIKHLICLVVLLVNKWFLLSKISKDNKEVVIR